MGLVAVLRELWQFRVLVAALALLSLVVGILMTYRVSAPLSLESRQYEVGIASARALVDTPSSQVVDLGGGTGADVGTLSARANLLASLMTSSPIKDDIARRADIPIELLVTPATPSVGVAAADASRNVTGAVVTADDPGAYVLRSSVPTLQSGEIPILAVDAQAPDAAGAAKLADQAVAVLRSHLENVAGSEAVPHKRRVTVRQLGPARSATEVRGPSRLAALAAALLAFVGGCGAILGILHLRRGWRQASQLDSFEAEPFLGEQEPFGRLALHGLDESPSDSTPVPSWLKRDPDAA
jgi:hypothetical protein